MSAGLHGFLRVQRQLLRIACRIVAAGPDAEDVVHDCWLRWNTVDYTTVNNAPAFLTRTVSRLSFSR